MTTLVEHARRELELLGQTAEDPAFAGSLVAALEGFVSYGHSGGSAWEAIDLLERLLRREALTPLTSDPAEWADRSEMSGSPMWQNVRDGRAMSIDGGATWMYVEARHPGERPLGGIGTLVECRWCAGRGVRDVADFTDTGPR